MPFGFLGSLTLTRFSFASFETNSLENKLFIRANLLRENAAFATYRFLTAKRPVTMSPAILDLLLSLIDTK
jgi:hypothetical protein